MVIICIYVFKYVFLAPVCKSEIKYSRITQLKESQRESLSFPLLIFQIKKTPRLREIKLNRFLKVTEKKSQIFPLPATDRFTLAWPSCHKCSVSGRFWPQDPGAQETLSVGAFPTPCSAFLRRLSAGGPDSKIGMRNRDSLLFSILKFILSSFFFFSQLSYEYWF